VGGLSGGPPAGHHLITDRAARFAERPTSWFGTLGDVPDQTLLSNLRGELEDERARLQAQISALTGADYDENFADSGQVAAEQGENRALLMQLRDQLVEIERALRKFDEGTYGTCERCTGPIGEARLEAMPATRYCINHA
jgi:DnaK suppressor protein